MDGELHAGGDCVVLVDAERGGADENLIAAAAGALDGAGALARAFAEDAPVPTMILRHDWGR